MSVTTYGWLILIFPLAGAVLIGLTFKLLPQRAHGVIGTLAIFLSFLSALGMLFGLLDRGEEERQVVSVAWDYANTVGVDAQLSILIDPLSTMMCLVVAGVSTLIHLYSVAYMGGQIFALMVMVVAACEVAVGLGLIVALYRRRLPIDVDELRELQG